MNETFTCTHCRQELPADRKMLFDGQILCEDCFDELTTTCERCGERIWLDDSAGDAYTVLCQDCYDDAYHRCADCGRLICNDDTYYINDDSDVPYCHDCIDRHRNGIQSYYYNPTPIFYGDGPRYLGVELEIDDGGESDSVAQKLMDIGNSEKDQLYIKHDGSLDEGMEIVTHPMTLNYHRTQMPWEPVLSKALELGYCSHKSGTCGLHVHVNRSCFGATESQQEEAIARVLFFVENHWNELLLFSRRTQHQLDQWAARYGRKDSPKEVLDHAKECRAGRYTCVNLTNYDTIEFRIFRGTLKVNTLIATLELVEELCSVAICYSDEDLASLTWTEFVSRLPSGKYPELIQYLKERRLYVNEPVDTAGED